jgi:hypothetical protein
MLRETRLTVLVARTAALPGASTLSDVDLHPDRRHQALSVLNVGFAAPRSMFEMSAWSMPAIFATCFWVRSRASLASAMRRPKRKWAAELAIAALLAAYAT